VVSQFTLYADVAKKNKPDFHRALAPEEARSVYRQLVQGLREKYEPGLVKEGEFGAMMQVESVNDGPVTFLYSVGEEGATL
jgi:D-tyrosyl-tRNA(Tyr) deacylase